MLITAPLQRLGRVAAVAVLALASAQGVTAPSAVAATPSASVGVAVRVESRPPAQNIHSASPGPRGTRRVPVAPRSGAQVSVPTADPSAAAPATAGTLLHNVNGVSSLDSAITNFNAQFEPPDQALCTGNGFVLEAVNSAYSIYSTKGQLLRGPFNVNDLFNEGAAEYTSDPRCYYDPVSNTWFATVLYINPASTESRVDLAVNTSGDPTGLWKHYQIDTSDDGRLGEPSNPGCPCLGDQPTLGLDQYNVYITTNEFSLLGREYNGAQIYAVARKDLAAGAATAHLAHFGDLAVGGAVASSVQPALSTGAANAEYFLSSLDPNLTFDARLGVWAMTDRAVVASGRIPTLSNLVVASEAYGLPPGAQQKGATSLLDSGDDRMQQVQYIGGTLWGELTTGVTVPGDTAQRAGAAWFALRPTLAAGRVVTAPITRQGYVIQPGGYVLYPALQADATGRAAMIFTVTGSRWFPSAAYSTLTATGTAFSAPRIAAAGTGSYSRFSDRWGDYSFAELDPKTGTVWAATEYIPPLASQTPDRTSNWGTRFVQITLG